MQNVKIMQSIAGLQIIGFTRHNCAFYLHLGETVGKLENSLNRVLYVMRNRYSYRRKLYSVLLVGNWIRNLEQTLS